LRKLWFGGFHIQHPRAVVDSVLLALRNTELVALRAGKRNGAGHWVDGGIVSRARLGDVGGIGCELIVLLLSNFARSWGFGL
jgi:hypothetical protein